MGFTFSGRYNFYPHLLAEKWGQNQTENLKRGKFSVKKFEVSGTAPTVGLMMMIRLCWHCHANGTPPVASHGPGRVLESEPSPGPHLSAGIRAWPGTLSLSTDPGVIVNACVTRTRDNLNDRDGHAAGPMPPSLRPPGVAISTDLPVSCTVTVAATVIVNRLGVSL